MLLVSILILAALGSIGVCVGADAFAGLSFLWLLPVSFVAAGCGQWCVHICTQF